MCSGIETFRCIPHLLFWKTRGNSPTTPPPLLGHGAGAVDGGGMVRNWIWCSLLHTPTSVLCIGISCNENANGKWKQIKHCVAATVVFFTRELSASVLGLWWFLLRAVHTPASTRANRWGHTMPTVYCEIILNPLKRLIRLSNEMKFGKNHLMPKDKYSPHSRRGRRRRVTGNQPTTPPGKLDRGCLLWWSVLRKTKQRGGGWAWGTGVGWALFVGILGVGWLVHFETSKACSAGRV